MEDIDHWSPVEQLRSRRLELEPLLPEHADEMAPLLDDPGLHTFIGGEPISREQLRNRYERQAVGSPPDRSERWLNWVVRHRRTRRVVGTVQATVSEHVGQLTAAVAWVIGTAHQHQGYAQEAAQLMVAWLQQQGVEVVVAHIHPQHQASMAVARAIGLTPTRTIIDGEIRWSNNKSGEVAR